jgi:hypothetical protein
MSLLTIIIIEWSIIIDTIDDGNKNKIWKYHKEKDIMLNNSKNKMIFNKRRKIRKKK